MLPKVPFLSINIILIVVILSCDQTSAKPFFNPFNVAIKTEFNENGNTISFIYPKNSYNIGFKFNSKQINQNKFDFPGLISSVIRKFTSALGNINPFRFSAMTTTTTERNLDFSGEEVGDIDSGISSNGNEGGVIATSESYESSSDRHQSGEVAGNENEYSTIETVNISYLPPISTPASYYIPPK